MSGEIPKINDRKTLREFGLVTGLILAALFGLFFPWLWDRPYPRWPWIVAAALVFPALLFPQVLNPIYRGWMKFATVLGWINSRILLSIVFYLLMTPFGFVMRIFGKDPLAGKKGSLGDSYRILSDVDTPKRMEDPF